MSKLYEIHNAEIARELIRFGFKRTESSSNFLLEAPATMSASKAKKVVSNIIRLNVTAKNLIIAQKKYEYLLDKINKLELL